MNQHLPQTSLSADVVRLFMELKDDNAKIREDLAAVKTEVQSIKSALVNHSNTDDAVERRVTSLEKNNEKQKGFIKATLLIFTTAGSILGFIIATITGHRA